MLCTYNMSVLGTVAKKSEVCLLRRIGNIYLLSFEIRDIHLIT